MIQNKEKLIFGPHSAKRRDVLDLVEVGLDAIDADTAIKNSITVNGDLLLIKEKKYDLKKYDRISVLGFGKASCSAAIALEGVLKDKLTGGCVLDVSTGACQVVDVHEGTHPRPSVQNVDATNRITEIAQGADEQDLVLVIVSGGGSSLLCASENECNESLRLYDEFLDTGGNITDLNVLRKHLSSVKGGGLAKMLYPATVIGLIFSDVPGANLADVASGPTYFDNTTITFAETLAEKYALPKFNFNETPKDEKFFEKVYNVELVSNSLALSAIKEKALSYGYEVKILSEALRDNAEDVAQIFYRESRMSKTKDNSRGTVLLAGGEPSIKVPDHAGRGGRNTHLSLLMTQYLSQGQVFASVSTDGRDNSDAAGALVDEYTNYASDEIGVDALSYVNAFNSYEFFDRTNSLIFTGPTGTNVADIMISLQK
jgi:glycerate-2-kinase